MSYIVIILAIVIILSFIFLRKHDDSKSDYVEPSFRHSGKKWVFNGVLDIDNPPETNDVFTDFDGTYQLMVKKGFVHYDLVLKDKAKGHLGLFKASAIARDNGEIDLVVNNETIASLPKATSSLHGKIVKKGGETVAYAFIASQNDQLFGEACIGL